ncbi:MAG: sulfurtransferase [Chloroflexi bacterium]|nr:sulfurtransferase [Chloroflexota bacterium]MDA1147546.1 sulfurtransferase [Chloroflexota bacterium]
MPDLDPNATSPMLVTTQWLADRLENPEFVLIDAGEAVAYRRVHIPGAVGLPHPYLKSHGNRNLVMPPEEFEPLARSWGLSNDQEVIIYDDNASLHAARVWWVLRYHGHRNVRVVDGGFNAWLDEGRALTSRAPRPEAGNFASKVDDSTVCMLDELKSFAGNGGGPQIWDTRSDEEWAGTESRGNKRVGRVPGAIHLEWRHLMQGPPARRFRPLDEIRAQIVGAGIDPTAPAVTYCQSGIRGAFAPFVLALLGNEQARNYDGSMGEWSNQEDTPLVLE